MVPSGPSAAWMALGKPLAPTALPANRLRLRTYSLCLTCFFALISTSLSRLAVFAPAYERLVAAPMLDRTRSVRTAPPPLALAGIFEPPARAAAAERESDDAEGVVDEAAAARCAPSLAMMREREMRGFRACAGCPPVTGLLVDARSGLVAARTATAAAASEVGRTGGGTASSGVVNILAPAFLLSPRGLFVIASRAELCGGVLARCATMLLVLDLVMASVPAVAAGLRVLARELAVGANSLDVALLGLNMLAAALLLPSAALSSSALFVVFVTPGPLLVGPGAARRCEPADNEFVADERGRPTLPFVPTDEVWLAEPASTLRRELVDPAGVGFKALAAVLLDKLADRGFVGPFLFDMELGGLERDDSVPVVPAVVGALLDAVRMGGILFRPRGASDGRDTGRDGFLKSPGFACLGSTAMPAVCDLVAVVVVVDVREAFVGDPALKFHTLRTIDLAEDKNPKRGFALPLSVRWVAH
jgi:hypothetical protein